MSIYIYVYVHAYECVLVYIYMYVYTYICIFIHIYTHLFIYVHRYVCKYIERERERCMYIHRVNPLTLGLLRAQGLAPKRGRAVAASSSADGDTSNLHWINSNLSYGCISMQRYWSSLQCQTRRFSPSAGSS